MLPFEDESLPRPLMIYLSQKFARYMHQDLNAQTIRDIKQICYDARVYFRNQGYNFPKLTIIFLEQVGHVQLVREDLDHAAIQRVIRALIDRFPQVQPLMIGLAIRRAFPTYHPDDAGQDTLDTLAAKAEKAAREERMKGVPDVGPPE